MITYILKSSICLVVMFGLYWFLLRQEKLFKFNRVFLIFSVLFSLSVPFISIPLSIGNYQTQESIITSLNSALPFYSSDQNTISTSAFPALTEKDPVPAAVNERISYSQILIILYFTGVLLLLIRFIRNLFFIYRQMKRSEKITRAGQELFLTTNQINPFCFFNTIFISKHDYLNNNIAEELISHEIEHIRQSHSIDVIFIELIKIIYWFNPVLILYSRAIRINHEYLADNGVIHGSSDVKDYADKLISFISCKLNVPLTSGFNPSLTRKRLIMLTKSRSGRINYGVRICLTFILASVTFLVLSIKPSYSHPLTDKLTQQQQSGVSQELLKEYQDILNKYKKTTTDGKESYSLSQNMPEKERLETIFFQMSKEQQDKQVFVFVPRSSFIMPKSTPTVKQFEKLKDPKIYGVWIDEIKVTNSELNKYKNTDFALMSESVLLKNAKDYGKYVSQVNLLTNEGYQTDYNETIAEKGYVLVPNKLFINPKAKEEGKEIKAMLDPSETETKKNEKLLIVDGVVSTKKLEDIPVENIERLEVLGNVHSTNRYGEPGKYGTIIITTKGKPYKTPLDLPEISMEGVVAVTNMNVLYMGIPNPIEIAVPGITSDNVTVTSANGTVRRSEKGWEVIPLTFEDLVLNILAYNIKVDEKIFRVKPIPAPVAVFAGKVNGSLSKDALATATLEAKLEDFLWDLKFEIESFTFAFSKDGSDIEIPSKGNKVTDEMKSVISDLKRGQSIIFRDIKAIGPDGKIYDLSPIVLKID